MSFVVFCAKMLALIGLNRYSTEQANNKNKKPKQKPWFVFALRHPPQRKIPSFTTRDLLFGWLLFSTALFFDDFHSITLLVLSGLEMLRAEYTEGTPTFHRH